MKAVARFFKFDQHGTTISREVIAGLTTFTTMSYIVVVNPAILGNAGIPAYGVSGLFSNSGNNGVHGLNEHIGVKELYDSKLFLYRLVKQLAAPEK